MSGSAAGLTSPSDVETFARDGVVCLRQVIGPEWIAELAAGMDRNIADPSPRGRVWDRDEAGRACLYDSQCWQRVPEYRRFVEESPMAQVAAELLGAATVNFFFDAAFVRTPGTTFRTPFHQDEPYWSVEGFDTASAWMPLVPVRAKSALEFVVGSHRDERRFKQTNFGALTGDSRDQVSHDEDDDRVPFPDIENNRDEFDIASWDMEPGDVAVFNARMIHGGSGSLDPDEELRVFNTKWLGDDVRVRFRPEGMDPDHQEAMTGVGLADGDRLGDTELYPRLPR